MVDPRFVTSDISTQEGVTFLMILVQKAVTRVQTVTSLVFREVFSIDLIEVRSVADDIIAES